MLKLTIRNLAKSALDNPLKDEFFVDIDKGKFVLRPASYEDELAYLVIKLHKEGKLTWSKDDFGRYVAKYKGLKIEMNDNLAKKSLVIVLDKDQYVLSNSPLIDTLSHTIWHVLDTPHFHLSSGDSLRNYYDKQEKAAKKAIDILKSR